MPSTSKLFRLLLGLAAALVMGLLLAAPSSAAVADASKVPPKCLQDPSHPLCSKIIEREEKREEKREEHRQQPAGCEVAKNKVADAQKAVNSARKQLKKARTAAADAKGDAKKAAKRKVKRKRKQLKKAKAALKEAREAVPEGC